jgi:hypothetical protein
MAAVTTERLIAIAYELAGWTDTPPDWMVYQPGTRISSVLVGLDVGPADLFMARQLGYHAVVSYRPAGYAGPVGPRMARRIERMVAAGLPRAAAIEVSRPRALAVRAESQAHNYDYAPSVARMLETPFVTVYDPLAEVWRRILQQRLDEHVSGLSAPTLADLRDAVMVLQSFAQARTEPHPALGDWSAPAGKTLVLDGAWGVPTLDETRAYFAHGVTTLCCADYPHADALSLAREGAQGNILTLGRIAAESVGVLPFIERLRADGVEVVTFAGVLGA